MWLNCEICQSLINGQAYDNSSGNDRDLNEKRTKQLSHQIVALSTTFRHVSVPYPYHNFPTRPPTNFCSNSQHNYNQSSNVLSQLNFLRVLLTPQRVYMGNVLNNKNIDQQFEKYGGEVTPEVSKEVKIQQTTKKLGDCYFRSFQGEDAQKNQNLNKLSSQNVFGTQQSNNDTPNPDLCSFDTYTSYLSQNNQQSTPITQKFIHNQKNTPEKQVRTPVACTNHGSTQSNQCSQNIAKISAFITPGNNEDVITPNSRISSSSSYRCIYELLKSSIMRGNNDGQQSLENNSSSGNLNINQGKKRSADVNIQDVDVHNAYEFWTPPSRKSAKREHARQTLCLPRDSINGEDQFTAFDEWTPQRDLACNRSLFQSNTQDRNLWLDSGVSQNESLPFFDGQPVARRISFGESDTEEELNNWMLQTPRNQDQNGRRRSLQNNKNTSGDYNFQRSELEVADALDARYEWEWDWDFPYDSEEPGNVRSLYGLLLDLDQIAYQQQSQQQQQIPLEPPPLPLNNDANQQDQNAQQQVKRKRKTRRRAKVLQEGHLSMVIYGHDERLMWTQRVNQFISKISTALGNREVGGWGGSVIDSIVGAFLTQNVSDRLSSQTYLNLVAHYPSKPSNTTDMADWNKVAQIPVTELALILKGRGMHNVLAQRIQAFLRRIRGITTYAKGKEALEARNMQFTPQQRNRMSLHLKGINDTWSQRVVRYKRNNTLIPDVDLDLIGLKMIQAPAPLTSDNAQSDEANTDLNIYSWGAKQLRSGNQQPRYPRNFQVIRRYLSEVFDELGLINVKEGDKVMCKIENTAVEYYQVLIIRIKQGRAKVFFPRTPKFLEVEMWIRGDSPRFWRGTWDDTYWHYLGGYAWKPFRLNVGQEVSSQSCNSNLFFPENDSDVEEDEYEQLVQVQATAVGQADISYSNFMSEVEDIEDVVVGDQGLSLEWLKEATEDEAREFLLQIAGLGRKSVACVMLLTLGMKDFPVDVNVGRICTRIGWVPLQVDQEGEQVDIFAPEPQVHRYLYHRLIEFDWDTLYKLHYLMITMGKTLCTRSNPNCLACPMYYQCEYAQNVHPKHSQQKQNNQQPPPVKIPIPLLSDANGFVDYSFLNQNVENYEAQNEEDIRPTFFSEKVDEVMQQVHQYQQLDKKSKEQYRWKHAATLMGILDEQQDSQQQQESFEKTEIRKKYIKLAKIVHPDKCMDSRAKEAFSAIGWAYQFLKGTIPPKQSEIQNLPESPLTYPRNLKVFQGYKVSTKDINQRLYNEDVMQEIEYVILVEQCILNVGHRMSGGFCLLLPWSVCTNRKFPLDGTYFQPNELFLDERSLRFPVLQENLNIDLKEAESLIVAFGVSINSISRGMTPRVLSKLFQKDQVCIRSFNMISRLPSWLPVQLIK